MCGERSNRQSGERQIKKSPDSHKTESGFLSYRQWGAYNWVRQISSGQERKRLSEEREGEKTKEQWESQSPRAADREAEVWTQG